MVPLALNVASEGPSPGSHGKACDGPRRRFGGTTQARMAKRTMAPGAASVGPPRLAWQSVRWPQGQSTRWLATAGEKRDRLGRARRSGDWRRAPGSRATVATCPWPSRNSGDLPLAVVAQQWWLSLVAACHFFAEGEGAAHQGCRGAQLRVAVAPPSAGAGT